MGVKAQYGSGNIVILQAARKSAVIQAEINQGPIVALEDRSDALLQLQDSLKHVILLSLQSAHCQHVLPLFAFQLLILHLHLHEKALEGKQALNDQNQNFDKAQACT